MPKLSCPKCNLRIQVAADRLGRPVYCSSCGGCIWIPPPDHRPLLPHPAEAAPPPPPSPAETDWQASPPPVQRAPPAEAPPDPTWADPLPSWAAATDDEPPEGGRRISWTWVNLIASLICLGGGLVALGYVVGRRPPQPSAPL